MNPPPSHLTREQRITAAAIILRDAVEDLQLERHESALRAQALADVASMAVEIGELLETLTPEEVAERAWRPGGPSREMIAERFVAYQQERAAQRAVSG